MSKEIDFRKMMSRAPRVRLGDYIEQTDERNSTGIYTSQDVRGISTGKSFIDTKANLDGVSLTSYKIVNPNDFAYVSDTSRRGDKIALAINHGNSSFIISSIYTTFRTKSNNQLDPAFLYIILSRIEFDRYSRFNSWGSARETFDWAEMQRVNIPLPSIEVQREIVATYEGLKKIAEENEALLEPLQEACHAYIVDCKAKYPEVALGDYIALDENINNDNHDYPFIGLNIKKEFMPTAANTEGLDRRKYKIIEKGKFVFSGMQTGRDIAIRLGLYSEDTPALITSAYSTFIVTDEKKDKILPEFIFLLFNRSESDRLGWFLSDSSVRSNLDWDRFCSIRIPLPPIEVQKAIVSIYHCMEEAKNIAREARELMKTICPALIQKAANSI